MIESIFNCSKEIFDLLNWQGWLCLLLSVLVVIALTWHTPDIVQVLDSECIMSSSMSDCRESFGSQFGFTAAVFAGLAFVVANVTFCLQGKAFIDQREKERDDCKRKDQEIKQLRVMELINEWNIDLVNDRIVASAVFDNHSSQQINIAQLDRDLFHSTDEESKETARSVMKVIRFIERWKNMQDADLIDRKLMDKLFPIDWSWWGSNFLPKLTADDEKQYYINTVNSVKVLFTQLKERHRTTTINEVDLLDRMGGYHIEGFSKVDAVPKPASQVLLHADSLCIANVASDGQCLFWCLLLFLLATEKLSPRHLYGRFKSDRLTSFQKILFDFVGEREYLRKCMPRLRNSVDTWTVDETIAVAALKFKISVAVVNISSNDRCKLDVTYNCGGGELKKKTFEEPNFYSSPHYDSYKRNMVYLYHEQKHFQLLFPKCHPNTAEEEPVMAPPDAMTFLSDFRNYD